MNAFHSVSCSQEVSNLVHVIILFNMASSSNKYDNCIAYSQGTCNSYSKYKNNVDQQLFNISELDKDRSLICQVKIEAQV